MSLAIPTAGGSVGRAVLLRPASAPRMWLSSNEEMGMTARIAAAIAAFVLMGTVAAVAATLPPGGSFLDDDANIHEASIEAIAAEGITLGCNPPENDLYCPGSTVTRGQMAAFLVRALDLPATSEAPFSDASGVFEDSINRLAAAGITKGCNPPTNDRFCPGSAVTRGQMAAFLVRALDLPATSEAPFSDASGVFEDSINRLAAAGITKGCNPPTNDRFCPNDLVKRDQMASFLTRALALTPIVPPPAPVVLADGDGVGGIEFGASAAYVENTLGGWLGSPSSDTGWYLDPCTLTGPRREVRWDALTVYFWRDAYEGFEGWSLREYDGPIPSRVSVDGDWSFKTTWAELKAAGATYDEFFRFWEMGDYRGKVEYSVPLHGDAHLTYIGAGYGAYLHGC